MVEILVAIAVDSVLAFVLIIATVRFIDWCARREQARLRREREQ